MFFRMIGRKSFAQPRILEGEHHQYIFFHYLYMSKKRNWIMSITFTLWFSFKSLHLTWTKIIVTWILKTKETMKRHKNFFITILGLRWKRITIVNFYTKKGTSISLPKCQALKDLKHFFFSGAHAMLTSFVILYRHLNI